jgi:glutaredoxin 3
MTDQPKVVVYTGAFCPYCSAAKNLLNKKGVVFEELRVDKEPELRDEMEARSRRSSVPQIFIGEHHVGGFDDMAELNRKGELDRLLGL